MTRSISIAFILFMFFAFDLHAQDLKFSIVKGKKSLGELHVSRNSSDEGFDINIRSQVKFWFFGTRRVLYTIKNRFYSKRLISASSKSTLNNKTRHETSITDEDIRYKFCDVYEEETSYCDTSSIHYTIAYMYFKEPKNISKVYSERYLEYLPIEKMEDKRYKVTLPNGTKNYFIYDENGLTKEVEVNHTLAKFYFKRIES